MRFVEKKTYQLGRIFCFSSVSSRIFFEFLTKNRSEYQLGAYQLSHDHCRILQYTVTNYVNYY